jgi:hypothetical protein
MSTDRDDHTDLFFKQLEEQTRSSRLRKIQNQILEKTLEGSHELI